MDFYDSLNKSNDGWRLLHSTINYSNSVSRDTYLCAISRTYQNEFSQHEPIQIKTWLKKCKQRLKRETYFQAIFHFHLLQFFLSFNLLIFSAYHLTWGNKTHLKHYVYYCSKNNIFYRKTEINMTALLLLDNHLWTVESSWVIEKSFKSLSYFSKCM